jgi:prophage maintenance system killer protein
MTGSLDLPALVIIAAKTLGLDTGTALGLLDLTAADAALADAALADPIAADPVTADPAERVAPGAPAAAEAAAALLCALIRHHPFQHGNAAVAVAAATTVLALDGWQADLEPPRAVPGIVAAAETGQLTPAALAAWLAPRLSPYQARNQEEPMHGWRPSRARRNRAKGMFRRFSPGAREVVIGSQREAQSLRHGFIGTEHLLLSLVRERDGVAARALLALGLTEDAVRQRTLRYAEPGFDAPIGHAPFTHRAKKALGLAGREAARLGHLYIGTEHLLLGLVRQGDGVAVQVLTDLGVTPDQIREQVVNLLATAPPEHAGAAGNDPELLAQEIDRLRAEVRRLQDLLLQHGIEAGQPDQRTA